MSSTVEILKGHGITVLGSRAEEDPSSYDIEGFNHPIRLHIRVFGGEERELKRSTLLSDYRMLFHGYYWDWEMDFMRLYLSPHINRNLQLLVKEEIMNQANSISPVGSWELPVVPTYTVMISRDYEDFAIEESIDNDEGLIPATESSIQVLERVFIDDLSYTDQCAICLDPFVGMQLRRMPCSHLYHEDCIVRWLRKCNGCPLCRYML